MALCCAAFALVWAAFTNDFSVEYIRAHSNIALNPAYKFAALWSGQEGSLLLWAFLLSAYGFVLRVRHRVDVRLSAFASVIMAGIQFFFVLLLCVGAPPFSIAPGPVAVRRRRAEPAAAVSRDGDASAACSTSAMWASRCRSPLRWVR